LFSKPGYGLGGGEDKERVEMKKVKEIPEGGVL
jgi:hypothetical protein